MAVSISALVASSFIFASYYSLIDHACPFISNFIFNSCYAPLSHNIALFPAVFAYALTRHKPCGHILFAILDLLG